MSLAPRFLQPTAISIRGAARDREVVDDQDVLAAHLTDDVEHLGLLVVAAPRLVAEDDRRMHHLAELVRLLAEADVGRRHDQVGNLLGTEVIDQDRHRVEVVDGDLEEPLDLGAVQVHRQDPVGPRRLDAVGADAARIDTRGSSFLSPLA